MIYYREKSLQFVFDRVAKGLLDQGRRCLIDSHPAFGNDQGLRCAYGHLDNKKSICLPKGSVINTDFDHFDGHLTSEQKVLMTDLMCCHDHVKPCRWRSRLKSIAKAHNLEFKF